MLRKQLNLDSDLQIVLELLSLNSPSKKVKKKDSYINGFKLIITHIFPRETYGKPRNVVILSEKDLS